MSDLFSLSLLQFISVLSFITSLLAVLRVGSGSLYRLSHKFDHDDVSQTASELEVGNTPKVPSWNWSLSGLPVSFSLGTLIGEGEEEERQESTHTMGGYTGGTDLMRMDWQVNRRPRTVSPPPYVLYSQPPASMAKLIMSRHMQRKPSRPPRRMPNVSGSMGTSRLVHSPA
jgi:hypothetical protein